MAEVNDVDVLAEIRELRHRLAELEAHVAPQDPTDERSTRRGMLRLAGAAVVGGAAASLLGAQPAAANSGAMQFGATNNAGADTTILNSTATVPTLQVTNTSPDSAVQGTSTGSGNGLLGQLNSPNADGYGVFGFVNGSIGEALVGGGGSAQLYLSPYNGIAGVPTSDLHFDGEVVATAGGFFACVATGTPGTWRKLAGTTSAGTFHAVTPTRVYDSRAAAPIPGILNTGQNRLVSVADGRDNNGTVTVPDLVPAGATAVAANVTVTGTTGTFGYLAINPGGNTVEGASTINWFGAGQTLANGVGLTLNTTRQVTVICNGGGSTHFLIDIAGYYL
ncbi:MAG: hypothetical protein HY826_14545 [Actinobacteria bacterium]|nr:hypothetical protein [Actinomycetota bacterium]